MEETKDTIDDTKILLIEDDYDTSALMKLTLERESFTVYTARDGIEALNVLEDLVPHIIICDIMMPNMDGYQFRSMISKDPELELVPFIFVTALSSIHDRVRGFSLNVDDYITKPFEPADLIVRVRAKLSKFKLYLTLIKFDNLTNFLNRRFFMTQLKKELDRVVRYNRQISLLMIDIDDFKHINDTYGHPAGDVVLEALARQIELNIRNADVVGRYGGEEFAIMMPETDKEQCLAASRHLRAVIESETFSSMDLKLTISGGVATAPEDGTTVKMMLYKADRALLKAKRHGKNCILGYEEK